MRYNLYKLAFLSLLSSMLILAAACQEKTEEIGQLGSDEITALNFHLVELNDLQEFRSPANNWSIAGNVQSDHHTEHSMEVIEGDGVLVNIPSDEADEHLFTELEHGDIELKLEFLVPKGSNSGIYFQGRYEVQILDSWGVETPEFFDAGGIYERWDESRPEGDRGFEGAAPRVNAALAPGLWQEYHILFRAPRFDRQGNKIKHARFEWVYLNGTKVQEDVELTGPTRAAAFEDEVTTAPLMLQGDHGPVAFRNIRYKVYQQADSLRLGEMEYRVYDYEGDRTPVDFEGLTLLEEGTTDSFNVGELSPKDEHYAFTFSGELEVPVTGDYLFQTQISNGGNLFINDELIVENTGEFDAPRLGNTVHLTEGTHRLDLTFFQIIWGTQLSIWYEGPGMERRTLASTAPGEGSAPPEPVIAEIKNDMPELVGGFVNYGDEKRTHILSVGNPEGIHYSYDLQRASLLAFWRGPFADVTEMWVGRGHEQLLKPLNAIVKEAAGIPITQRGSNFMFENHGLDQTTGVKEFTLNNQGQPVFRSAYNGIEIEDSIRPASDDGSLIRSVRFKTDSTADDILARIAQGESIELLENGLYRINGRYYLQVLETEGEGPEILEYGDIQALFIPVLLNSNQSEIQYRLVW